MTYVQHLQQSQNQSGLPYVLSNVHLVRGQGYSPLGANDDHAGRVHGTEKADIGQMAGVWTQRGRDSQTGKTTRAATHANWPGRGQGVRGPIGLETALSQDEVRFLWLS